MNIFNNAGAIPVMDGLLSMASALLSWRRHACIFSEKAGRSYLYGPVESDDVIRIGTRVSINGRGLFAT